MHPMKKVMTAGLVAAALGVAPAIVTAQETAGTAGTTQTETQATQPSTTGTTGGEQATGSQQGQTTPGQQTSQGQGGGGADQEAVRQHLASARQSLAELTQLPAAGQLDGEQRQQVSEFISHFNEFATATTDWREKYERVDQSLDRILGTAGEPGAAGAASPGAAAPQGADAAAPEATAGTGGFDPTIISKLRETREHLDAFELATGDPGFVADRIARILDNAQAGEQGSGTVGTTGATATGDQVQGSGASATGMVTLSQSQVEDIRRHLERLRRR